MRVAVLFSQQRSVGRRRVIVCLTLMVLNQQVAMRIIAIAGSDRANCESRWFSSWKFFFMSWGYGFVVPGTGKWRHPLGL